MTKYSRKASIYGLAYLLRPYNDIDVYIEDSNTKAMYQILFDRILDKKAKVDSVISLSNKDAVIKAAQAQEILGKSNRRKIYIIDGDFESIFNESLDSDIRDLYQLNVYCSENLLLSNNAIIEIAFESYAFEEKKWIEENLDFANVKKHIVENLYELLLIYIVARKLDKSIRTVKFNVNKLRVDINKSWELSPEKINDRYNEIYMLLERSFTKEYIDNEMSIADSNFENPEEATMKFMSGKTYLVPIIFFFLKKNYKYRGNLDQLKVRLALHCDLDIDPNLPTAILNCAKGI